MYCINCGKHVDDNADVCLNCGVLIKRDEEEVKPKVRKRKKRKYNIDNMLSIISCVFGGIALVLSLMLFFKDIKDAGMYTEIWERVVYALRYSLFAIFFAVITFILALSSKKDSYSKVGLGLSIFSFFLIVTEVIVVIIY